MENVLQLNICLVGICLRTHRNCNIALLWNLQKLHKIAYNAESGNTM